MAGPRESAAHPSTRKRPPERSTARRVGQEGKRSARTVAPYLDLAHKIELEVARAGGPEGDEAGGPPPSTGSPRGARARPGRRSNGLPADEQWAVVERVFDDDESGVPSPLSGPPLAADGGALAAMRPAADPVRARERLTLGLFREHDVRAALSRGQGSSTAPADCRPPLDRRWTVPGDRGRVQPLRRTTSSPPSTPRRRGGRATVSPPTPSCAGRRSSRRTAPRFEPVLYPGGGSTSRVAGRGRGPTAPWLRLARRRRHLRRT